jgi:hypothetical protein
MFGFSDSNNNNNSSSSSNSNDIFNNKIIFINFNNIIKTKSSKASKPKFESKASKPASAEPTSTTSKPKASKPASAKPNTPKSEHKSNKSESAISNNVSRELLIHNNNNENTKTFISALKMLYKTYISTTTIMKCESFLNYATNLGIFTTIDQRTQRLRKQNLKYEQQDIGELMININKYLLKYYKCNIGIYNSNVKLNTVNIINNIINKNNTCNFILYYLFGNLFTSKLTQIYYNDTKPNTTRFQYALEIDLQIKFNNTSVRNIVFDNINDLIKKYNEINGEVQELELGPTDLREHIIKSQNKTELPISFCGKYIIISLIHETPTEIDGLFVPIKIPIIITDITKDLVIDDKQYEFIGASEHMGQTTNSGHYVSYIKKNHKGKVNYYLYNDTIVTQISNMEELTKNKNKTYRILIYKCKDDSFYMNNSKYTEPIKKLFDNNKLEIKKLSHQVNSKLIGSINYRNSCYFNSLLVLLMHIPEFVYLILNYNTIPTLLKSINNK